jgi:VanZ family protein
MKSLYQRLSGLMPYVFVFGIVLTTYLLLIEMSPSKAAWTYTDKIEHAMGFFLLATSARMGFPDSARTLYLGLAFYGALMEVLQGLLTVTREASVYDWFADVIGIFLCVALAKLIQLILCMRVEKT